MSSDSTACVVETRFKNRSSSFFKTSSFDSLSVIFREITKIRMFLSKNKFVWAIYLESYAND